MKTLQSALLDDLSAKAADSRRRRANHNLHRGADDPIQRFLNAIEPGTYVRPHRHRRPGSWELLVALRGAACCLCFNEERQVTERVEIRSEGPNVAVEIPGNGWHTLAALCPGTILLEVKEGPYIAEADKEFALWAPKEGDPQAPTWEAWFRKAEPGTTAS